MELLTYIAVFVAGGLAFLALAMAIEKGEELRKEDKPKEEEDSVCTRVVIRCEERYPQLVCARVNIPHEKFMTGWDTDTIGIKNQERAREYAERRLKELLVEEAWKYVQIEECANPLDFSTEFRAGLMVVRK